MATSPSTSSFCSLPNEMIDSIFQWLDVMDLCSLRPTCRRLCTEATPRGFEELKVWLDKESLQKLVEVAAHTELRTCVKTVSLGLQYYYDMKTDEFIRNIYDHDTFKQSLLRMRMPHGNPQTQAWAFYRGQYQKQCALEESNIDVAMLTGALKAFSSLIAVRIVDVQPSSQDCSELPWAIEREGVGLDTVLAVPSRRLRVPRGRRQLQVLIESLASIHNRFNQISIELVAENIGGGGFLTELSPRVQSLAPVAFAWIRRLDIRFSACMYHVPRHPSPESSITTILRALTGLEALSLDFRATGMEWRDFIQISRFGQLKNLAIRGAMLDEAHFRMFLSQSCQLLKTLELGEVPLNGNRDEEGSDVVWDRIFEAIRSLETLQQIKFWSLQVEFNSHIFSAFEENALSSPEPLYDYLLKRTDENPWVDICQTLAEAMKEDSDALEDEGADANAVQ